MQAVEKGQYAEHRFIRVVLEPVDPRSEEPKITSKTVDDETGDPSPLRLAQERQRAHQMGKHAAAVDVRHQQYRTIDRLGEAHVGDVAVAQIDLRRAARTFHQDHAVLGAEALIGRHHRRLRDALVLVIGARVHGADGMAVNDDLRADIGVGFEQHRVHVAVGRKAAGPRLHRLSTADLTAIHGDRAIERHVLRFERRDACAATREQPAQARDQRALSRVRSRALHHQGRGLHGGEARLFAQESVRLGGFHARHCFTRGNVKHIFLYRYALLPCNYRGPDKMVSDY